MPARAKSVVSSSAGSSASGLTPSKRGAPGGAGSAGNTKLKKMKGDKAAEMLTAARNQLQQAQNSSAMEAVWAKMQEDPPLATSFLEMLQASERAANARKIMDRNWQSLFVSGDWFKRLCCNAIFLLRLEDDNKLSPFHHVKGHDLNLMCEFLMEDVDVGSEYPVRKAAVNHMVFLIAMVVARNSNWMEVEKWIAEWQHARKTNVTLPFLSKEVWTHRLGVWKPTSEKMDDDGVPVYSAVHHRPSQLTFAMPFGMTIPKASTIGPRPDAYIENNANGSTARLKVTSSGMVIPLLPLSGSKLSAVQTSAPKAKSLCTMEEWGIVEDLGSDTAFSITTYLAEQLRRRRAGTTGVQIWHGLKPVSDSFQSPVIQLVSRNAGDEASSDAAAVPAIADAGHDQPQAAEVQTVPAIADAGHAAAEANVVAAVDNDEEDEDPNESALRTNL